MMAPRPKSPRTSSDGDGSAARQRSNGDGRYDDVVTSVVELSQSRLEVDQAHRLVVEMLDVLSAASLDGRSGGSVLPSLQALVAAKAPGAIDPLQGLSIIEAVVLAFEDSDGAVDPGDADDGAH